MTSSSSNRTLGDAPHTVRIISALSGKVAAVSNDSHERAAHVVQWPYTSAASQHWELVSTDDGKQAIRALSSGQVLAVSNASKDPGRPLIQWPSDGDPSQQWQIEPIPGRFVQLLSLASNNVIAVSNASKKKATPLVQWPYDGNNSQRWELVSIDGSADRVKIVSLLSGQVISVASNSTERGANLLEYPYEGHPGQQWQLVNIDGNRYEIRSVLSNQSIGVAGGSRSPGAQLVQWPYDGAANQQWTIVPSQLVKIVSRLSGQVVAVSDGSKDNGKNLVQWPYESDSSQQWEVAPVSFQPLTLDEVKTLIGRYGPILHLHSDETHQMCSIDWFLQHASLWEENKGEIIRHPGPDQLPGGPKQGSRYWLTLDDGAAGGQQSTARAYVRALSLPGTSFTDLQFWFFYAYNGPGTLHVKDLLSSGDANLGPLGEHVGDWENAVLRIDNATKQLLGIWLGQHDSGAWFEAEQLAQFQRVGEQIVLYSSRNGHATYPSVGANPTHAGDWGVVSWFLRNDTSDGGAALDCARSYEIVSGPGVTEPRWLDYPYRWGPEHTRTEITREHATNIVVAALGKLVWNIGPLREIAGAIVQQVITSFYTDDLNGPDGPKQKAAWNGNYG